MASDARVVLTPLLVVASLLGGCTEAGTTAQISAAPTQAVPAGASATTGGINGVLIDDETQPVAGAPVGIRAVGGMLANQTASDEAGAFSFSFLEPGDYEVAVQSSTHKPAAKKVPVSAGEIIDIRFILKDLPPAPGLLIETFVFRGYITCSLGWYNTVIPLPPGNPVGNGTPEQANFCSAVVSGDADHFDVPLNQLLTFEERVFKEIVLELVWQPGTAFSGSHLRMDVCSKKPPENNYFLQCKLVSGNNPYDRAKAGPPPLVMRRTDMPVDRIKEFEVTVGDGNWNYTTPRVPFTLQQSFNLWMSLCYFDNCTQDYSARPP